MKAKQNLKKRIRQATNPDEAARLRQRQRVARGEATRTRLPFAK